MRAWLSPSQLSGAERPTKQTDGLGHPTARRGRPRRHAPRLRAPPAQHREDRSRRAPGQPHTNKRTVVACVLLTQRDGTMQRHTRTFGARTADLLALADWLTRL